MPSFNTHINSSTSTFIINFHIKVSKINMLIKNLLFSLQPNNGQSSELVVAVTLMVVPAPDGHTGSGSGASIVRKGGLKIGKKRCDNS